MAKRRPAIHERSHGLYRGWSGKRREVPQVLRFTDVIPARVGVEFGYVLHIAGGHGAELEWRIEHPPFPGPDGKPSPAFSGSFHVRGNDFEFFLGDTVWEPWRDKCGPWTLITAHAGQEVARRTLLLVPPAEAPD